MFLMHREYQTSQLSPFACTWDRTELILEPGFVLNNITEECLPSPRCHMISRPSFASFSPLLHFLSLRFFANWAPVNILILSVPPTSHSPPWQWSKNIIDTKLLEVLHYFPSNEGRLGRITVLACNDEGMKWETVKVGGHNCYRQMIIIIIRPTTENLLAEHLILLEHLLTLSSSRDSSHHWPICHYWLWRALGWEHDNRSQLTRPLTWKNLPTENLHRYSSRYISAFV